ncbi:hypothetical protein H1D32_08265 [Anaerobacillus sp. CMMVII]|uniref:hypothetical protein n=1 Tax=Anaerobacillus sp. CMMVII TaxID=2755588 RepID=UPI0021B83B5A|nr:hypothetical protein [Anaerobacillus sp. CMMVII]MCT8137746.1 hypothetical protein [Anaerobacillus sp. CMMVII]MCT8137752.1 hypothetical protein [Anaerobacillus sp. CMMVII]
MKDSKIYASMILSILSSSKDKQSAFKAVRQNFAFQGTLRMEIEALFEEYKNSESHLIVEFMNIIEQFDQNAYPYIANITLKPSRREEYHSS